MGYELHITRRSDWWEDGENITESDWRSLIDSDPTLTFTGGVSATTPEGNTISYDSPLLAEWKNGDASVPFDFRSGRVVVKNPDGPILSKMIEIAELLNAKVVGDEGEVYTTTDTHGIALEGIPKTPPAGDTQQSGGGCLGVLAVLLFLAFAAAINIHKSGANKAAQTTASPSSGL